MITRCLKRSGLQLTEMAFGTAHLGRSTQHDRGDEDTAALQAAWDEGVRFVDTAPHYSLGRSEIQVGVALRRWPRDEVVLSTKVGRVLRAVTRREADRDASPRDPLRREWDFSVKGIRQGLESSLQRLGTDRIEVVLLHDPDDHWAQAAREGLAELRRMRTGGVVGAIGVGMNQAAMLARFVRETDIDVVLLAGRYTLLDQGALDDLLPAASERGVSVIIGGAFNSGLLATDWPSETATYDYVPAPEPLISRARRIAEICERHGTTLPAAALHFPLGHPAVATVLVGMRTAEEVQRNVKLYRMPVPDQLWDDLRASHLLHPAAPTPP